MIAKLHRITSMTPAEAAKQLAREASPDWLARFASSLPDISRKSSLQRIIDVWGLSQSEAAEIFGVTRQALSKWLKRGVPSGRYFEIADMDAATDILGHYLKPERIPAVVRRPAANLDNLSLLTMVAKGKSQEMLAAVREMFMFGRAAG